MLCRSLQRYLFVWKQVTDKLRHFIFFGIIDKMPNSAFLHVDNGKVYISRHMMAILVELQVKRVRHPPYQSYCKGKVEATAQQDHQEPVPTRGPSRRDAYPR